MSDAAPAKPARFPLGALVNFLIAAAALGLAVYAYGLFIHERHEREALEKRVAEMDPKFEKFKDAVREVDRHLSSVVYQEIDVPGSGWQSIAGGFYVIDLATSSAADGKGVKVTGKVINPTSVVHENAQLTFRVGEKKASFTLPRVPPGVAQTFDVTLPDVAAADAKRAFMSLDGSTISFSSSTTSKGKNAGPLDTDKLLK
jgi:hypothetical protein